MAEKFDLVALGTGSAASVAASRCRAAGWQVAIVDPRPFGGTCALRGCDPKKVLVGAGEILDWARRMEGKGVVAPGARIDWPQLMRFKCTFTDPVPESREQSFAKAGIAAFHGRARFLGLNAVQVNGKVLEARHVVVATGRKPAELKIPGQELVITSDQFLELERLPRRLVFIGGGYISFEFAHLAARAGAQATILHRGPRPLALFDPFLVDLLVERTRELGIALELSARVSGVSGAPGKLAVRASTDGRERSFEADAVVHGAGRVPDLEDLELEKAGVEWDARGVKVNEYLQSVSNPSVYAAGDAAATAGPPLTPVAGYEGKIAAANLLGTNHLKADYAAVPSVVFTVPPLAAVGLREAQANQQGLRFRVNQQKTAGWYSSRRTGETCSGFKVLIEEKSERILGAHLLGAQAEETINLFALAMRAGLRAPDLKTLLAAYPTHASDVQYML